MELNLVAVSRYDTNCAITLSIYISKKRYGDNKNDSIMIFSIVRSVGRGGVCVRVFFNLPSFVIFFLSPFRLEIVLKIRVKHGEHYGCFRAVLLKSLLASITIFFSLLWCTWLMSCLVSSVRFFSFFLPLVHRMAPRIQ